MFHRFAIAMIAVLWIGCVPAPEADDNPQQDIPTDGGPSIETWLATRAYQAWKCELRAHPAVPPSPHGSSRVCINKVGAQAGTGELPVGSGWVKEFLDGSGAIVGYSTQRHTRAGSSGATWYWYERVPVTSNDPMSPHDSKGVVADGWGFDSPAYDFCVGCHSTAGRNGHSGHDFVFTFP
jgi:hypothetical protein